MLTVLTNIRWTKVLHLASYIMHHASCIMHHPSCIIHHASCICHHMKLSPSEKNSIYSLKSLMSPSEHVTIWKNYSLSYQYEHVTIWFVTKCILFISVTILVWNFKMVTGMNSSYQASIRWYLSPYGGLVWKIFIPVTKKTVQMVTVWEVLP